MTAYKWHVNEEGRLSNKWRTPYSIEEHEDTDERRKLMLAGNCILELDTETDEPIDIIAFSSPPSRKRAERESKE